MGTLNVNLDAKAQRTVALARGAARRGGDARLETVHVLAAALMEFPKEAERQLRESGGSWSAAMREPLRRFAGLQPEPEPMPVSRNLSRIMRTLARDHRVVTLEALLAAILREKPDLDVLSPAQDAAGDQNRLRRRGRTPPERSCYRSRRDWLADLRTEWTLRRTAARQACGMVAGFDGGGFHKPYSADTCLDAVARAVAANRAKAAASPADYDPLAPITGTLDEVQRGVCEGVLVHQLYGLFELFLDGFPVRALAQMLDPEIYPGNCRRVLEAVDRLESDGLLTRNEHYELDRLGDRVSLADRPLEELLTALENDAISAGEVNRMKRRLRHESV